MNLMSPSLHLSLFHYLLTTTTAVATMPSLTPSPTSPKPTDPAMLLRLDYQVVDIHLMN
jgi:hypothetical protein